VFTIGNTHSPAALERPIYTDDVFRIDASITWPSDVTVIRQSTPIRRYAYECPRYERTVRHLYSFGHADFACRHCLGLRYRCRHIERRYGPIAVADRLRRRLGGVSTGLLSPLPPRPRGAPPGGKYDKTIARIMRLEAKALAALRRFTDALEREALSGIHGPDVQRHVEAILDQDCTIRIDPAAPASHKSKPTRK